MRKFSELTRSQQNFTDKKALELAKENCSVLIQAMPPYVYRFGIPKPKLLSNEEKVAAKKVIWYYRGMDADDFLFYYFWVLWGTDSDAVLQKLSTYCYYLACSNSKIIATKGLSEITKLFEKFKMSGVLTYFFQAEDIFRDKVKIEPIDESDEDLNLPEDLLEHLSEYLDMHDVVREIVRLQELSPKVTRNENLMQALVTSWNALRKEN